MIKYCIIDDTKNKVADSIGKDFFEAKLEALEYAVKNNIKSDLDEYYIAECEVDKEGRIIKKIECYTFKNGTFRLMVNTTRWYLYVNDEAVSGDNNMTEYNSESEALKAAEDLWGKLSTKTKKALFDFKVYKFAYDDYGDRLRETVKDYLSILTYDDYDVYQRSDLELHRIEELLNYLDIAIISDDDVDVDANQPSIDKYHLRYQFGNGWITTNKARNGKDYIWYYDGNKNAVIDIESGKIIDDDKFIDDQFC